MNQTASMTSQPIPPTPPRPDAKPAPRRRIALVGHACSPNLGSEPGLTWKWGLNLSRLHDIVVFCHPQYRAHIDEYLAKNPTPSMQFEFITVESRLDPWKPGVSERGIRLHYALWQKQVAKAVAAYHRRQPIDLVHHVSWGSLNQPPHLWKTGLPFLWGPVGGGQTWPAAFLEYADSPITERLRTLAVSAARFNPAILRCARRADMVCATNHETADILRRAGARRVELLLDNGIVPANADDFPRRRAPDAPFTILWAGRLEPRKGLPLALQAMARLKGRPFRMLVAGDGPQQPAIRAMVDSLGLGDQVELLGRVPYKQMTTLFGDSDVFLFTSLRESMGSVTLEVMGTALPIIALDHQGAAVALGDGTGIMIPVQSPQQVIDDIASAVVRLSEDPALRQAKREALIARTAADTWARRAEKVAAWYEEILRAHRAV